MGWIMNGMQEGNESEGKFLNGIKSIKSDLWILIIQKLYFEKGIWIEILKVLFE